MPQKQTQSETLSLPQLLQLAGIGGQPQQDSTREALSYMMGQQRLAADEADRKAKESQFQQDLELRRKALEQQSANADATGLFHAFSSEADPTRRALLFGAIAEKYPSIGEALAGQQAAEAQQRAVAQAQADVLAGGNKAQTGATITKDGIGTALGQAFNKFDPTTTADYAGNEVLNQLMNFIYSAGGHDPGPRIPTATDEATAQFVSDAQYNTKKHMENKKRRAAGLPTIEEEVAKYKKPEPVAWYDFPTQVLNLERAQAVEEAQKQTAEYLKRKAALRQAAGFQP